MQNLVFLGGAGKESTWREQFIPLLDVPYWNPLVNERNEPRKDTDAEDKKKYHCNIHLYVITSDINGFYPFAEVTESAMNNRKCTILHIIPNGFNNLELRSLKRIAIIARNYGAIAYIDESLSRSAEVINIAFK